MGILRPFVKVNQAVTEWWNEDYGIKLKPLFQTAPAIIFWQCWKKRNTIIYGGSMTRQKAIQKINHNLYMLAGIIYPWIQDLPKGWLPQMV